MSKCSVPGCSRNATHEVILYDVYLEYGHAVFYEQDYTCPFICATHLVENELRALGTREPRGYVKYPYTNKHGAQGFTIYKPL